MPKETIDNKILKYMKDGNRISQWTAYELFSYTRLSATIFNLKERGYNIYSEFKKSEKTGKKYKEYWLQCRQTTEVEELKSEQRKEDKQSGLGFTVKSKYDGWPD